MSWQEELRRLDEELAAGQLSADDYRARRDAVLSSAVNADPQAQQASQGASAADSTQIITPVSPPPQQPQQQPGGSEADRTQIVSSADAAGGERTQVVPGTQQQSPPYQPPWATGPSVPGVPPQAMAAGGLRPNGPTSGGFPMQQQHPQQQPWNTGGDAAPPWGASEYPQMSPGPDWVSQGPETFETTSSGGKKKFAIIAVSVLVVAALGVGGYLVFGTGSNNQPTPPAASSSVPPAPTSTVRPKDDLEIAKLPAPPGEKTDIQTFADVERAAFLTPEENAIYKTAGASKVRMAAAGLPDTVKALVLTAQTTSSSSANVARDDLTDLERSKYTMKAYSGSVPDGVKASQFAKSADYPAVIRAHYVHKGTLVRIEVSGSDLDKISKTFDDILEAQLAELPANG
ncbi:flagellar basal body protein FliL [Amycolatopsis sp. NPDC088138]|uniref:flagellar basal body protein FliL n=1 Tax=Amycolatopsis sp. NPDC088138 TaxID=3363938 RepID=UPI00381B2C2F